MTDFDILRNNPVYLLQINCSSINYDLEEFDFVVKNCISKCVDVFKEKLTNYLKIMDLIVENVQQLPQANIKTRLDRCRNWLNNLATIYEDNEVDILSERLEISPAPNFQLPDENIIPSIIKKLKSPIPSISSGVNRIPVPDIQYFTGKKTNEELIKCSNSKIEYFVKTSEDIKLEKSEILDSDKKFNDVRMKKVASEFQKLFPKMSKTYRNKTVKSVIDDKKKKNVLNLTEMKKIITPPDKNFHENFVKPKSRLSKRIEITKNRPIPTIEPSSQWDNTLIKSPKNVLNFDETKFSVTRKSHVVANETRNTEKKPDLSLIKPIPAMIPETAAPFNLPPQNITYNINSNCTMNIYTICPPWPGAMGAQNQLFPPIYNNNRISEVEPSKICEL